MDNFVTLQDFKTATKQKDYKKLNNYTPAILPSPVTNNANDVVELKGKLEQAKKQNGLIEKAADKIKNATNIGYGSKKLEQSISDVEKGTKNKDEVLNEIKNYRRSQENTVQAVGDVLSVLACAAVFFAAKNNLVKGKSIAQLNMDKIYEKAAEMVKNIDFEDLPKKYAKFKNIDEVKKSIDKLMDSKTIIKFSTIPAMFVGMFVKENALKLNRIGTKQYKPDIDKETMTKDEIKKAKKQARKDKANANLRNSATGLINGLTMPIIGLLGPVGVPLYIAVNSLSRYFIGTKEDSKEKSIEGYINNLKSSKATHALAAAAMAVPLVKSAKFSQVLEQNAQKVVEELKNAKLKSGKEGKSVYSELEDVLFGDKNISEIIKDENLSIEEKIRKLSETNIFALKFKQISNDGSDLTKALREKCPQTWNLEDAQKQINSTYGEGKYKLKKCVGTGTVAQTFVAQDKDGKNVCIKLIHQGIDEQKIIKDKEAFIQMINSSERTPQEKKFLIDNIENLASGIQAEVNLQNEMDAAQKLAKSTKMANVVKPIEVKNNIYVMERADGISLADFNEYSKRILEKKAAIEIYKKGDSEWYTENLNKAKQELEEILSELKEKIGIDDFNFEDLTQEETVEMIKQYQNILNEQFSKVDAQGKVIHGDIHPGNIFIDVKKLKAGDKKFFTLIDTGNTIEQTKEQALRFMNLTKYIKNADVDNIVDFVLEGAIFPEDMPKEKAREELIKKLNTIFFDKETSIGLMTNDSLLALTDNLMKDLKIIPSSTQGNLLKAKKSSRNSLEELYQAYGVKFFEKLINNLNGIDTENSKAQAQAAQIAAKASAGLAKDVTALKTQDKTNKMLLERSNLAQLTPAQRLKIKRSPNTPKANSQEALTYMLKQYSLDELAKEAERFLEKYNI